MDKIWWWIRLGAFCRLPGIASRLRGLVWGGSWAQLEFSRQALDLLVRYYPRVLQQVLRQAAPRYDILYADDPSDFVRIQRRLLERVRRDPAALKMVLWGFLQFFDQFYDGLPAWWEIMPAVLTLVKPSEQESFRRALIQRVGQTMVPADLAHAIAQHLEMFYTPTLAGVVATAVFDDGRRQWAHWGLLGALSLVRLPGVAEPLMVCTLERFMPPEEGALPLFVKALWHQDPDTCTRWVLRETAQRRNYLREEETTPFLALRQLVSRHGTSGWAEQTREAVRAFYLRPPIRLFPRDAQALEHILARFDCECVRLKKMLQMKA